MRRFVALVAVALAASVLVPTGAGAQEADTGTVAAAGGLSGVETVGDGSDRPYEARLTRGGFVDFGARLGQRRPNSCLHLWLSGVQQLLLRGAELRRPANRSSHRSVGVSSPRSACGWVASAPVRCGSKSSRPSRPVNPTGRICCRLIRRSRVFTPGPNRITTVNVNLPIFQSRAPNVSVSTSTSAWR